MLSTLLTAMVLLGFDSFLVCLAVSTLPAPSGGRRYFLVLAFGACDGLASLLGSAVGVQRLQSFALWSEWLGPACIAGYGVYVLCLAWRSAHCTDPGARWLVFSVPICLSLDNLVAGVNTEVTGLTLLLIALAVGVVSSALALIGLHAGAALNTRGRFRADWLGGSLLVIVAGSLVFR